MSNNHQYEEMKAGKYVVEMNMHFHTIVYNKVLNNIILLLFAIYCMNEHIIYLDEKYATVTHCITGLYRCHLLDKSLAYEP